MRFPSFCPKNIIKEQLYKQFGSGHITTEHDDLIEHPVVTSLSLDRSLLAQSKFYQLQIRSIIFILITIIEVCM